MEESKPSPSLVAGKVYLIPTTLGDNAPLEVLPISIKRTIENIDHYIVENEKTARRFIKKVSPGKSQADIEIETINKYSDPAVIPSFLDPCIHGDNVGVLSDSFNLNIRLRFSRTYLFNKSSGGFFIFY
ncbi:MAG: hypothetical protein AAFY00_13920, partial [Bacteroidota bacterium]